MSEKYSSILASFGDHDGAEMAVGLLIDSGISKDNILLLGGGELAKKAMMGHWHIPESESKGVVRMGEQGGAAYGGMIGLLEGIALFFVPGVGEIAIVGPLIGLIVGGVLGAGFGWLNGLGLKEGLSGKYRQRLSAGHFIVMATVPAEQAHRVEAAIRTLQPMDVDSYPEGPMTIQEEVEKGEISLH